MRLAHLYVCVGGLLLSINFLPICRRPCTPTCSIRAPSTRPAS